MEAGAIHEETSSWQPVFSAGGGWVLPCRDVGPADGRMGPIKPGLEFILRMHPDLVVVPCGLQGFHEAWPKSKALQLFLPVKHKLSISFGAAQTFSARQSPGEFVTQLMEEVARQAGQRIPASPASGEQQQSEQEHLAA